MINGLTREVRDRRIAVAIDVIQRFNAAGVIPVRFMANYLRAHIGPTAAAIPGDLRELLPQLVWPDDNSCAVCAKGALLVSKALLFNAAPVPEGCIYAGLLVFGNEDACSGLADTFDRYTLDMIEAAFEANDAWLDDAWLDDEEDKEAAVNFGLQYETPIERLHAIMMNIVANDGEFRPDIPSTKSKLRETTSGTHA